MRNNTRKKMEPIVIITDSREQCPWTFSSIDPVPSIITKGLKTGDYSLDGFEESGIVIERKSASDLFGSVGKGRERLEAEFERMSCFNYAAIIIEDSLGGLIKKPPSNSRMNVKSVINTLMSWSIKYNVHVWACEDRILAEKVAYGLFKHFYRQQLERI